MPSLRDRCTRVFGELRNAAKVTGFGSSVRRVWTANLLDGPRFCGDWRILATSSRGHYPKSENNTRNTFAAATGIGSPSSALCHSGRWPLLAETQQPYSREMRRRTGGNWRGLAPTADRQLGPLASTAVAPPNRGGAVVAMSICVSAVVVSRCYLRPYQPREIEIPQRGHCERNGSKNFKIAGSQHCHHISSVECSSCRHSFVHTPDDGRRDRWSDARVGEKPPVVIHVVRFCALYVRGLIRM